MKIVRITSKQELDAAKIDEWAPVNYRNYPILDHLAPEETDILPLDLYELLIDKYQIVKVRTEDGKETFMQAVYGQCDDSKGRRRTCDFEYVPCLFESKELSDRNMIKQLEKEMNQVLWGCGLKLGYLEIFVPWNKD